MLRFLFRTFSSALSIYMFLCLIRVFLTWLPELNRSQFGRILAEVCDPYLNFFRRLRLLQIGGLDFSPVLALGALTLVSSLFSELAVYGVFRIGVILASLLNVCWSLVSSLIGLLNILTAIRLVFFLLKRESYTPLWNNIDRTIYAVSSKITGLFARLTHKRGAYSFTVQLVMVLVAGILVQILGSMLIGRIAYLIAQLPF